MLSNEAQIAELKKRQARIKEALHNTVIALGHDDYNKAFEFKAAKNPREDQFNSETLKNLLHRCEQKEMGMDLSLVHQHIEKIALEKFNETVKDALGNKSIKELMEMRHEIELLMLREQFEHYSEQDQVIEKDLEKMTVETATGVATESLDTNDSSSDNVTSIKKKVTKKK